MNIYYLYIEIKRREKVISIKKEEIHKKIFKAYKKKIIPPRAYKMFNMHLVKNCTIEELSKEFDVTQERVRQVLSKGLKETVKYHEKNKKKNTHYICKYCKQPIKNKSCICDKCYLDAKELRQTSWGATESKYFRTKANYNPDDENIEDAYDKLNNITYKKSRQNNIYKT